MKRNLSKTLILSSGLLLSLSALSGCGKSKEVKSNPPPTVETTQAPPAEQQQPQIELPKAPGQNDQQAPPVITNPNQNPDDQILTPPGAPQQPGRGGRTGEGEGEILQPPGLPVSPGTPDEQVNGGQPLEAPIAIEDLMAYQIDFKGQQAIKTGGQSGELFYTSAGADELVEEFKSYNGRVAIAQQAMNTNLAKAIVNAKLSRASSSGAVTLSLTIDEFGTEKIYRFSTTEEGDKLKLSLASKGTTGEMQFQGGFVKCVDEDGECNVAYAKIKLAGGYTRIIFRNSLSNLHFLVQENIEGNSNFSLFSSYALNAGNQVETAAKFSDLELSSFEVINGRAAMGALLMADDSEMIGMSIPLVVSGRNSEVNASVAKVADLSKNYDIAKLEGTYSTNLSQRISEIKLVNNNGLGQFKLQIKLGTPQKPASVWIVVARTQTKILSLEEIRSFEAQLKAF